MNKYIKNCLFTIMAFTLMLAISCKKSDDSKSIITPLPITDIDGNVYDSIRIGTQVWMVQNLKTTHYRNGDSIPNVTGSGWLTLTTGAYCNYANSATNGTTYGRLYNWFAVNDSRKIAPNGWHVASDAEWTTLTTYLGTESVAGGKLKEAGFAHWQTPNTSATNSSGFSALPGGARWSGGGLFFYLGTSGEWWTSTQDGIDEAFERELNSDNGSIFPTSYVMINGFSVRCVKD